MCLKLGDLRKNDQTILQWSFFHCRKKDLHMWYFWSISPELEETNVFRFLNNNIKFIKAVYNCRNWLFKENARRVKTIGSQRTLRLGTTLIRVYSFTCNQCCFTKCWNPLYKFLLRKQWERTASVGYIFLELPISAKYFLLLCKYN